jgi:hypothetical protein
MHYELSLKPLMEPETMGSIDLKLCQMECMYDEVLESITGDELRYVCAQNAKSSISGESCEVIGFEVFSHSK